MPNNKTEENLLDFDDDMLTPVSTHHHQPQAFHQPTASSDMGTPQLQQPHLASVRGESFSVSTPTSIPENTNFVQLKKFVELTSGNQQHLLENDNTKIISPLIHTKLLQRKVLDFLKELDLYMSESQDIKKLNASKISKVLDEVSLYFATENMVDEKLPYHVSVSLAIDGDRISSTMSTLLNRLISCKFL